MRDYDRVPGFTFWTCYKCKTEQAMPSAAYDTYMVNQGTFHCVHGHPQYMPDRPTEADKLRGQLLDEQRARQRAEQRVAEWTDAARDAEAKAKAADQRANGYKGYASKLRKRAEGGACPCCNRTFRDLQRHMASRHPGFGDKEVVIA